MDKPCQDSWPQVVRSGARKSMIATWAFAGFWNLVAWPVTFVLPDELAAGNQAALAVLLFPLMGVLLAWWAVKISREWFRYGVTELTLDPWPGAIGGHVGGSINVRHADADRPFEVTLECVRSYVSGSGKNRSRKEDVCWETSGLAEASRAASSTRLEFRFDVPEGLPESDASKNGSYHFWRLRLKSEQPGITLDRAFELGVFETRERSTHIETDTSAESRASAERRLRAAIIDPALRAKLKDEHGLEVDEQDGWLRLYLHRGRQKGMALGALLIGIAFSAVMIWLPDEGFSTSVMRVAFGCFGIGLTVLGLWLPLNTLDVRVSRRRLKRVRAWCGLVIRTQQISPLDLAELEIDKGASQTSGNKTTVFYELVGKGSFGTFKLMESIPDRMLVEAIRRQVMLAAGLKPSPTH